MFFFSKFPSYPLLHMSALVLAPACKLLLCVLLRYNFLQIRFIQQTITLLLFMVRTFASFSISPLFVIIKSSIFNRFAIYCYFT